MNGYKKRKLDLISTGYLTKSIEGMKDGLVMLRDDSATTGTNEQARPINYCLWTKAITKVRASQQRFQKYKALSTGALHVA